MSDRSPKSKQRDHLQKKAAKDKASSDAKSKQDKQVPLHSIRPKVAKS